MKTKSTYASRNVFSSNVETASWHNPWRRCRYGRHDSQDLIDASLEILQLCCGLKSHFSRALEPASDFILLFTVCDRIAQQILK
jgi:hypothetical protein